MRSSRSTAGKGLDETQEPTSMSTQPALVPFLKRMSGSSGFGGMTRNGTAGPISSTVLRMFPMLGDEELLMCRLAMLTVRA